jgi:hypothetical protein
MEVCFFSARTLRLPERGTCRERCGIFVIILCKNSSMWEYIYSVLKNLVLRDRPVPLRGRRKAEVGGQGPEGGSRKSEGGRRMAEGGGREGRGQRSEVGGQKEFSHRARRDRRDVLLKQKDQMHSPAQSGRRRARSKALYRVTKVN